jgi:hypothetical protein
MVEGIGAGVGGGGTGVDGEAMRRLDEDGRQEGWLGVME